MSHSVTANQCRLGATNSSQCCTCNRCCHAFTTVMSKMQSAKSPMHSQSLASLFCQETFKQGQSVRQLGICIIHAFISRCPTTKLLWRWAVVANPSAPNNTIGRSKDARFVPWYVFLGDLDNGARIHQPFSSVASLQPCMSMVRSACSLTSYPGLLPW